MPAPAGIFFLAIIELDAALQRFPNVKYRRMARDIAASHHERYDMADIPEN